MFFTANHTRFKSTKLPFTRICKLLICYPGIEMRVIKLPFFQSENLHYKKKIINFISLFFLLIQVKAVLFFNNKTVQSQSYNERL